MALDRAVESALRDSGEARLSAAALAEAQGDHTRLAAHEIRGHLAVLGGYLSMLEDGTLGELPRSAQAALAPMEARVRAMRRLVEDMLEDARHHDGRLHLSRRAVDLRDVLREAADDVRGELSDLHELHVVAPQQAVEAWVDPGRVGTIIRNLLDNAVKYSPSGGVVECRLESDGAHATIAVSDEGVGIGPEDAAKLFRRFGRGAAEGSGVPGVGLGLYICRTLARLHGGDVTAERRSLRGMRFVVTLPLQRG